MKEKSIEMAKCVLVYCISLFIMAMGVSFSGTADLGMSPVNSIPYVLSEIFTSLSMGTWIIIIFSVYILIQFVILGRDFQPWRILQLICTTLFGYFTDFTNFLADLFLPDPARMTLAPAAVYGVRLLYLFYQYGAHCPGHPVLPGAQSHLAARRGHHAGHCPQAGQASARHQDVL